MTSTFVRVATFAAMLARDGLRAVRLAARTRSGPLQEHAMLRGEGDGNLAIFREDFGRRPADDELARLPAHDIFDEIAVEQPPLNASARGMRRAGYRTRAAPPYPRRHAARRWC